MTLSLDLCWIWVRNLGHFFDFFFLRIVDVTSDWVSESKLTRMLFNEQLTFELYAINHELWIFSLIFCVIPAMFGIIYFVHWYRNDVPSYFSLMRYRKYTQTEEADVLKSWLIQYRAPFFAMMIVSSR
eukprot:UN28115